MGQTLAFMGGPVVADESETVSALRWWLESGVDTAVQEQPRNWFEGSPAQTQAEQPSGEPAFPQTLEAFRDWLSGPEAPLFTSSARPVLPKGAAGAEVMVLCESPGRDEIASGQPVGNAAAELMERMLRAVGLEKSAYFANLSCFHSPSARPSSKELDECARTARHHVALVAPKRLLLLGDTPCRALLGKALIEARGHVHKVETIRTIATFHPRQLLKRPSDKALAWKDLLLLTEDLQ